MDKHPYGLEQIGMSRDALRERDRRFYMGVATWMVGFVAVGLATFVRYGL